MNTVKPMYGWETINWTKVQRNVFKLQKRIYRASERGDVKAVRKLQRLLTNSRDAKLLAVRNVTQDNRGKNTAGVDGVKRLRNKQKLNLAESLTLNDKAQPTRRVWIPKPGKDEKRPLGIPTMRERAKQALVKLALEPEWEAKFEPNSYGFRPGRSAHDAIAAIFNDINQKDKYVLDADIEKCFDQIDHQKLLEKVNTYPKLRRQIKAWLKSGVMDGRELFPTEAGTPQGGVLPLLANIALHGLESLLESHFNRRVANGRKRKVTVIRYADDFVILDTELQVITEAKEVTEAWLKEIGLKLKDSKTRITHTFVKHEGNIGFDFLGFNIRQYPCSAKQSGAVAGTEQKRGFKTIIKPSKEAIERHLKKIDDIIQRNKNSSQEKLISVLNPIIRGWSTYYSTVSSKRDLDKIDSIVFQKLRGWAFFRRSRNQNNTEVISNYWGVNRGLGWKFITPDNKYCLEKHSQTPIKGHIKVKGQRSLFDGDCVYWDKRLSSYPGLKKTTRSLLKRQNGKCNECGLSLTMDDMIETYHRDGNRSKNKLGNLELLHGHCHDIKHIKGIYSRPNN
ncbi:group II intron reverse transcriptase/maturase [Coleofasciculus sp.]|uniref:group II intron reverse transcriptase/maturase n=1 Tax=Coleofasciculus sp. TaxID=3100458 RepID=UPI003A3F1E63